MMRVYIAGKITGNPDYEDQFAEAENKLRADGFDPINPAVNPEQPSWSDYMRVSMRQLLSCDAIALLDGWQQSKGASLEAHVAESLQMLRIYL